MILLVEDEEVLRTTTRDYLQLKGHSVVAEENMADAIAALDGSTEGFDLPIVDHQLPDGVGWQIVAHAQQIREDVPVIYASGYYVVPEPEGVRINDDHIIYLPKPFEMMDLLDAIDRVTPDK